MNVAPACRRLLLGLGWMLAVSCWLSPAAARAEDEAAPAQDAQTQAPSQAENPAQTQAKTPTQAETQSQAQALSEANSTVVGVQSQAVEDARSASTLGARRIGSGVVIDPSGLVLTIGYLIVEAEHVDLVLEGNRSVPARVVAYDVATGFGLVQSLVPLHLPSAHLGEAARLDPAEPMMMSSGGSLANVTMVKLVSRRAFSGYWEYHIDGALFTAPARPDHSGAALFNAHGELVGIGSLLVSDTLENEPDRPRLPGNMFVPIDLLKPILGELRASGTSRDSRRAWIGLNCIEIAGQVRVLRVTEDSPAAVVGLQRGDRIVRIDGVDVGDLETLWKTLWQGHGAERDVQLDIERGDEPRSVTLHSVDRMNTLRHAQGI